MSETHGARPPQISSRQRQAITKRLMATSSATATAALAEINRRYPWYAALDADNRSWIGIVARAGIDGFVTWFADPEAEASGLDVFAHAPRTLARHITLQHTVELVRTTIDVVESRITDLPRGDRPIVQEAILRYSRELAFAAAEVYARAAETRGAWDARLEALVVDAIVRGETDESVLSRASTLGWRATSAVCVVVGSAPEIDTVLGDPLRRTAHRLGLDVLASVQGDHVVLVLGGDALATDHVAAARELLEAFGAGPVVVGPLVDHLIEAPGSARAALSGHRAAIGWPEAPRPVAADDLLPERALAGDGHARRALAREVFGTLTDAGGGLAETLVEFLDHGASVEGSARALFVHANTVRYRLKRIHEVTGFNPFDARDAYVLRIALTLGRLLGARA